jgi:hypothetical protein
MQTSQSWYVVIVFVENLSILRIPQQEIIHINFRELQKICFVCIIGILQCYCQQCFVIFYLPFENKCVYFQFLALNKI